jgi:hypothetical protein
LTTLSNDVPITSTSNDATNTLVIENGPQFNFAMYVHYKAFTELWLEQFSSKNKDFASFQKQFEQQIGRELLLLFCNEKPSPSSHCENNKTDQNEQECAFYTALGQIDDLSNRLVAKGFVAQIDRTPFEDDTDDTTTLLLDIKDWSQQLLSDVSWSIALDNDITLSSQILLQEQGIRFYPNYIRCMIQSILQQYLEKPFRQRIVTEDYYMDTDYNSDPDKFEVKEVLININMENVL